MKNLEQLLLQVTDLKSKMREIASQALAPKLTKRQRKITGLIVEKLITDQNWSIEEFFDIRRQQSRTIARIEGELVNRYKNRVTEKELGTINRMKTNVGPKHDKARFFGIEIECIVPHESDSDDYCDDCEDSSCDCILDRREESVSQKLKREFRDARLFDIEVKGDGSISDYEGDKESPVELTFTCSINNLEKIDRVCKVLNTLGARVNKSCGLHVHVDMRKRDAKVQGQRLVNALPILRRLVPESRRTNTYCVDNKGKLKHSSRYYAVNFQALRAHGTVEVRLHSSTTNAAKIKNWVSLLNSIVECTKLDSKKYTTIDKMITDDALAFIGLDSDMRRFFLKREAIFSDTRVLAEQSSEITEAA